MANTRIKDLNNTATTVPSDAYVAIDGSANGTAKISRDNLRQDTADAIAAAPSTYNLAPLTSGSVDVDKGGTGSTTVAGAKTTLQIPNVGTAANEVPTNGQLGNMSFQNSEAVTVDDLTVDGHFTGAVGKPMPVNAPSMRLDGSNDYVDFAVSTTDSAFTYNNGTDDLPYSISGWIKVNSDATQLNVLTKWSGSTATSEWLFRLHDDKTLQLWLRGGTPYFYVSSADALTSYEGQWIHVSASYAGAGPNSATSFANAASAITLYINGKSIATTTTASGAYAGMVGSTQNVWIGRQGSVFSEGEIRDVKLFNKELSAAEVKEVYSNGQLPNSFSESTGTADVVVNGDFASDTVWVKGTNWSIGSGAATLTSGTGSLWQTGIMTPNKKFRLTYTFTRSSGSGTITGNYYNGSYQVVATSSGASGTVTAEFTKLGTSDNNLYFRSTDGFAGSIDNVSLVQIGSVLDARAEQFDTSTGKLYDLSGNDFVGTQSGGVSLLGREFPVYETGTWTPSVSFGGGSTGVATSIASGFYTRIGNLCHISCNLTLTSKGSDTGTAVVTGLPFTAGSVSNQNGSIRAVYATNLAGLTSGVEGRTTESSTDVKLQDWGATGVSVLNDTNWNDNSAIRLAGTYQIQ